MDVSAHDVLARMVDVAPLVLRLALAAIFIAHGSQKLFGAFGGHGIPGTAGFLEQIGIRPPTIAAWAIAIVEFGGGVLLLIGLLTRIAALGLLVSQIVAVGTVHGRRGFFSESGGFEYNLALIAMLLALIVLGPGAYSVDRLIGWKY